MLSEIHTGKNKMYIVLYLILEVTFINVTLETMLVLQRSDKNGWNETKMLDEDLHP